MRTIQVWLISIALILVAGPESSAETIPNHPLLQDAFFFRLGGYYPRATTAAALAPSTGGTGVMVDFEDTLGLEKRNLVPIADFMWRATDHWRMEVDYFAVDRNATRTLATDVVWGDQTFNAGDVVDSTFDFSDLRVSAAYAFFRRPDKELGVGLGLHVADIKAHIQSSGTGTEAAAVTAPLPVINLYGLFALTDEWAVSMNADWLSLAYGDYSGDVRNMAIDVLYQPYRHVGFGLGVRSLTIDVEIDHPDWDGAARMNFQGPTAYVTYSF
jgi:hypothetical protein